MKKSSILLLQIGTLLLGIGTVVFLLWEPHLEGRNVNSSVVAIYFKDPFLVYVYIASIFFFVGLYHVYKLLNYLEKHKIFSQQSVYSLQKIKYCALTLVAFIIGAEGYFFWVQRRVEEDIAGGVMLGLVAIGICCIIAAIAAVLESILQRAVDMKSEHDVTV